MKWMSAFGVLFLAATGWAGPSPAQGNDPKSGEVAKPDAENVLSAWASPGAPEGSAARRTVSPPVEGYDDLAQQEYTVEQPFQKVWEFYAAKCGEKRQYKPGLNLISGGGDRITRYLLTLRQDAKVPENGWCQFVVHSESFWVVVEIHSPDTKKNRTSVTLTAGARAGDDAKKAELKWARSVADDLFAAVIADDHKGAATLLTGEYAKLLQGQEKATALPDILRRVMLPVGGATAVKTVTVTSEEIASDKDEARFKGHLERQDCTQEFVVRVVKEKESGRWRVSFVQVEKPKYLKK